MEPTPELIHALWREEVEGARKLSVQQKLALSGDLFDGACEVTLSGIKWQNLGVTDEQAREILRQRLELGRRLERITVEF